MATESPSDPVPKLPLILIVGPTAVGKTEFAILLAERLRGEIVSADSRLFYRGMDIGTAKPSKSDRNRVPHYLIDISDPDEGVSLAEFQQLAGSSIADISSRGRVPLLVGGTGQYVRAVTQAWHPPAVEPDHGLRSILEGMDRTVGGQLLYRRLRAMDPEAAAAIDPRNRRRTVRALEVILKTGKRFSAQQGSGVALFDVLALGLKRPRPDLYARVDARIDAMFAAGLLDEVSRLLAGGYGEDLPAMSAIGYRQCVEVLRGQKTVEDAKADMRRLTRVFVRRQTNWFRESDPDIRWFDAADAGLVDSAEVCVREFLAKRLRPD